MLTATSGEGAEAKETEDVVEKALPNYRNRQESVQVRTARKRQLIQLADH